MFSNTFGKPSASNKKKSAASSSNQGQDEWERLKAMMLPTSFGKQQKSADTQSKFDKTKRVDSDETKGSTSSNKKDNIHDGMAKATKSHDSDNDEDHEIGPPPPQAQDDSDAESEEYEDETESDILPTTHEIRLQSHTRTVSALDLDPSGTRIISGSYDYTVKFWDFTGMDSSLRPFRSVEPVSGHQILDLQWSTSGDQFLLATHSMQPRLFDRDGAQIEEYMKGDPYIRDPRNTAGHVGAVSQLRWHPFNKQTFVSAAADSTIRIWDVHNKRRQTQVIVYKAGSGARGAQARTPVTAITYSPDGKMIVGAAQDGSIRIWNSNGPYNKASMDLENAHMSGSETSSLIMSKNCYSIISRGGDDTVKVFDIRKFTKALSTASQLPTLFPQSNVALSPDEKIVIAGTSVKKNEGEGRLVLLDRNTMEVKSSIGIGNSSAVKVLWHSKINQILVGTGAGHVHVFYDPHVSVRGAKLCVSKGRKVRHIDEMDDTEGKVGTIITPHALPMFKETATLSGASNKMTKRKRDKLRKDPVASRMPERPITGPGRGGQIGTNELQIMMKSIIKDTSREEDPREAILRHAQAAAEDPYWIAPAYKKTQPKAVLAEKVSDEEEEEEDEGSGMEKKRKI